MEKQSKKTITHDSNPFSTTITGIKKLFELNLGSLISVNLFSIFLYFLMGFTGFVMFVSIVAFVINNTTILPASFYISFPYIIDYANSMDNATIYTSWIIGTLAIIFLGVLVQAIQTKLAIESAKGETIKLGEALKSSIKRIPALLGLIIIPLAISVVIGLTMFAIFKLPQPLNLFAIIIVPVLVIATIYITLRLVFSNILIIDESIGPIKAIKRSWEISRKHLGEVIGIISASMLMISMPISLLQSLIAGATGPAVSILQMIVGLASLISASLIMVAISERFVQLRHAHDNNIDTGKTHNMNYLAVVFLLIAGAITGSISSATTPKNNSLNSDFSEEFRDFQIELENSEFEIN